MEMIDVLYMDGKPVLELGGSAPVKHIDPRRRGFFYGFSYNGGYIFSRYYIFPKVYPFLQNDIAFSKDVTVEHIAGVLVYNPLSRGLINAYFDYKSDHLYLEEGDKQAVVEIPLDLKNNMMGVAFIIKAYWLEIQFALSPYIHYSKDTWLSYEDFKTWSMENGSFELYYPWYISREQNIQFEECPKEYGRLWHVSGGVMIRGKTYVNVKLPYNWHVIQLDRTAMVATLQENRTILGDRELPAIYPVFNGTHGVIFKKPNAHEYFLLTKDGLSRLKGNWLYISFA